MPKKEEVLAEGRGWFKVVRTAKGVEARILMQEYKPVSLDKVDEPQRISKRAARKRK